MDTEEPAGAIPIRTEQYQAREGAEMSGFSGDFREDVSERQFPDGVLFSHVHLHGASGFPHGHAFWDYLTGPASYRGILQQRNPQWPAFGSMALPRVCGMNSTRAEHPLKSKKPRQLLNARDIPTLPAKPMERNRELGDAGYFFKDL